MAKAVLILALVAAVTAIEVSYVAPEATSYIYRSDNAGPASLIKIGAQHYEQPKVFAAPIPLKYGAIESYDLEPNHLPYIAAKPIVVEDHEDDDDGDYGHDDGYSYEKGDGSDYAENHHAANGEKGNKGYHSKGHHAKGQATHYNKGHAEGYYKADDGENKGHVDVADAHGKQYVKGESYKGGDHGHKNHHSKGEEVTGYHKVFNKDEFKKDHDFYDVADNSGNFNKHGYENEKHASAKGAHTKGDTHNSGYKKGGFGKAGSHAKGHAIDSDLGHTAKEGHDSHYNHQENYGKKGGNHHNKAYAYADDDGDDGDDSVSDEKGYAYADHDDDDDDDKGDYKN